MTENSHSVLDAVLEACARAAHEANRAYCIALGDTSHPSWEDAPDWQKKSALNGVRGVLLHDNGPRESHASWLREKELTGWTFGPVKDVERREHPCCVPYDELPLHQVAKDGIFVATVRAIAQAFAETPATRRSSR